MASLDPGAVLGGCRIEEPIGRGGMGVVYRARQVELERDVAVKVVAPERVADPDARRRFLREVRAAAAIEHPNVLPVHEAGVHDGCAFVVMRYVDGADLRTLVRTEGPLAPGRAVAIVADVGAALDAIHAAGYVHRDVKPANVLVARDGHVYLSDFGLAKQPQADTTQTEPGRWVGTVDFAAPEQIRGDAVDARTDVYALGGVLYFALTGHAPFERETEEARIWAHLSAPPPAPSALRPELPRALDAVVRRALAKVPDERPQRASALARAARAAVDGGSTVTAAPARPAARRRRRRFPLALGLAAALAAAVAGLLVVRGGGEDPGARAAPTPTATPAPTVPAPAGPRVTGTVTDVGYRPRGVAVAGGDVWVVSHGRERIARIDARTLERDGHQPRIAGAGAWSIAGDGDDVWVTVPRRGRVLRIDARTGRVTGSIRPPLTPVMVAPGRHGLWITGRAPREQPAPDVVYRYDRSGQLREQIEVPDWVSAIAASPDGVWIGLELRRKVRHHTAAGRLLRAPQVTEPVAELAFGAGSAWGSIKSVDGVTQIAPRRPAVTSEVAGDPAELTVAGGRVFVASHTDHTVVILDANSGQVVGEPIRVGLNPHGMTAGAGHVWVTGMGDNSLTRIAY